MKIASLRWGAALVALFVLGSIGAFAQGQREVRKVAGQFALAFEKEDWPEAVKLGERLVELAPKNHLHPYNLACAHARGGAVDEALTWLERAAAEGFSNPEGVLRDEDLLSVRDRPRFAVVVEQIQANYDRARALFREIAKGSEAVILAPSEEGNEPLPVLLLLHGYGDKTESFTHFFEGFAEREGVLLVGVRSVVQVPMQGFEWATPVDTKVQIRSALAQAAARHALDRDRIYLLGFSQGGRMALEAALERQAPYRGVIAVGARLRKGLENELPAEAPPLFLMVGGDDGSAASNRQGAKALKNAGHRVELRIYPGVGHSFPRTWKSDLRQALRWIDSSG